MSKGTKTSKHIGGTDRARVARQELKIIFTDPSHPLHLAKDIELAKKFDIARHTIYKIRDELNVPGRLKRIVAVLNEMNTAAYTLKEISAKLDLKYQNIYKIMIDENLPYKKE